MIKQRIALNLGLVQSVNSIKKTMKNNKLHIFFLFLCAFFWGTTFAAQSIGANYVGAYTYLAGRSWIAVVVLTPVIMAIDHINKVNNGATRAPKTREERRFLLRASIICGTFLFIASWSQQYGLAYTSTAKSSFLTALYVVLVPVCSIFLKKKPPVKVWFCVVISVAGMVLLCLGKALLNGEPLSLEKGDLYELLCALFFTVQVLNVDYFAPKLDGVRLSRLQFLVVAIESTVFAVLFESGTGLEAIYAAMPAILYAGVFSSGVAYTLQIIGQVGVNPTIATLVMSLEAVIGSISGWIVLGETMQPVEICGGALMFAAIVISQVPFEKLKKNA